MSLDMWLPRLPFAHRLTGNIHQVCKLFLGKAFSRRSRTRLSAKVILISPFVFDGLIIACSPFCAPPTCAFVICQPQVACAFSALHKAKGRAWRGPQNKRGVRSAVHLAHRARGVVLPDDAVDLLEIGRRQIARHCVFDAGCGVTELHGFLRIAVF